ncbi:MAG: hypothetical protein OEY75_01045 [Hylemonella sp.]|nr:hypothetical protein [Hylemonella sp.]MDH5707672.1 hypothetical protein [Hylemonella sp.]
MTLLHLRSRARLGITALALSTAACGGGGGGGGGGSSATSGSTSCPTYAVGNRFIYNHSSVTAYAGYPPLTPVTFTRTVTVTNTASGTADMQATFSNSSDVDRYFHESTSTRFALTRTTHTHTGGTDTATYVTPFQICTQPAVGTMYTANVQNADGSTNSGTSTVTAVSAEAVTVPAGNYPSARRIAYLTKFYDGTGAYLSGSDIATKLWFDDAVGVVKEETSKTISVAGFTGTVVNTITLQSFP